MGLGRDRTRDPWICSQTRICCQTRYRLRYATRYIACACSFMEHSIGLKRVKVRVCGHHVAVTYYGFALTVNEAGREHRCYTWKNSVEGCGGGGVLTTLFNGHQRITQRVVHARTFFEAVSGAPVSTPPPPPLDPLMIDFVHCILLMDTMIETCR